jgi:hypothetical protein
MSSILPLTGEPVEPEDGDMNTNLLARDQAYDRYNLRERLLARLLATSLDRQLASGRLPLPGSALAIHASQITSPAARGDLVQRWFRVLELARQPAVPLTPRAPLRRHDIAAAEAGVRELIAILASGRPIAARGVATASLLLTDGTGPLYNGHSPASLGDVIRAAVRYLDPASLAAADRPDRDHAEYAR